jgi:MFS family permease
MYGLSVAVALLKNRDMRRLMAALGAFALTEHGTWLAIMVFAYQRGGVGETGVVLFAMLVPSAVAAPLAARAIVPLGVGRALVVGFALQAALLAVTATVLMAGSSAGVVYAAALASSVSLVVTRPAAAALLPSLARSVEELTAANATSGLVAMIGLFAGPAAAGFLLATTSLSAVFWGAAGLMIAAMVLVGEFALEHDRLESSIPEVLVPEAVALAAPATRESAGTGPVRLLIGLQAVRSTLPSSQRPSICSIGRRRPPARSMRPTAWGPSWVHLPRSRSSVDGASHRSSPPQPPQPGSRSPALL